MKPHVKFWNIIFILGFVVFSKYCIFPNWDYQDDNEDYPFKFLFYLVIVVYTTLLTSKYEEKEDAVYPFYYIWNPVYQGVLWINKVIDSNLKSL